MRALRHVLTMVLVLAAGARAQSPGPAAGAPVKIAEGSYSDTDRWVLWRTESGYKTEIQILWALPEFKQARQTETLELTRDFYMKRVRYETQQLQALPDGALDCTVEEQSLECTSTFRGQEGRGSILVSGAYAAQFGVHMAFLDLPWFFTTLVANGLPDPKQTTKAGVVSIAFDGDTKDRLITANPSDAEITYVGRERLPCSASR